MDKFLAWRKTIITGLVILSFGAFFTLFSGIDKLKEEEKYLGKLSPYSLNNEELATGTKMYELVKVEIPFFENVTSAPERSAELEEESVEILPTEENYSNDDALIDAWRKLYGYGIKKEPPETFSLDKYSDILQKINSIVAKVELLKNEIMAKNEEQTLPLHCNANPCITANIAITRDGAKLDCGGYTLLPNAADTKGIVISANNVVITNCGLERFTTAIEVTGEGAVIFNNKIKDASKDGLVLKGGGAYVLENTFESVKNTPINISPDATQNTFYKNTISNNDEAIIVRSRQNNFMENVFQNNNKEDLILKSDENFITKNHFFFSHGAGIAIYMANKNIIFQNDLNSGKSYGIYAMQSNGNWMIANEIKKNDKQGIYLEDVQSNDIVGNNISENKSDGIWISGLSVGNKIRLNEINGNGSSCSISFGEVAGAKPENNTVELNNTDKEQCL